MLRITGDSEEVIIREMPVLQWFNAFIVAAIVFLFTLALIASGADFSMFAVSLGVFVPIVAFLVYLLTFASVTVKINKPGQTVAVRKRSLFRYDFKVYSFSEIADSIYVNQLSNGFNTKYQMILPLKNAPSIELSSPVRMSRAEYFEATDLMNKFIFDASKQLPLKSVIFDNDE